MNSRCKKKITPICQHFKLPLEQILHLTLVQSQSHIGYTHSCKLKGARKGPWIWHTIVCTTKLVGHSLASFWPGPTPTFPSLHPQLRRVSPAETIARRALAARHCFEEGQPAPAGRHCLAPLATVTRGVSRHLLLPSTDITVTLPSQRDVHSWDGNLSSECQSQTFTDLVL